MQHLIIIQAASDDDVVLLQWNTIAFVRLQIEVKIFSHKKVIN